MTTVTLDSQSSTSWLPVLLLTTISRETAQNELSMLLLLDTHSVKTCMPSLPAGTGSPFAVSTSHIPPAIETVAFPTQVIPPDDRCTSPQSHRTVDSSFASRAVIGPPPVVVQWMRNRDEPLAAVDMITSEDNTNVKTLRSKEEGCGVSICSICSRLPDATLASSKTLCGTKPRTGTSSVPAVTTNTAAHHSPRPPAPTVRQDESAISVSTTSIVDPSLYFVPLR